MTTSQLELLGQETVPFRYTVKQYHEMIRLGILPEGEPFELLDGQIVRKERNTIGEDAMTVGNHHIWVVMKLAKLSPLLEKSGCHMRTQQPTALPPQDEPEPDGAIILGNEDNYRDKKPGADDILCVIEVADASLRRDRGYKLQLYAKSGIETYIIINLPDRCVEVYTRPSRGKYAPPRILLPRQEITFPTAKGKALTVAVRKFLP